VHRLPDEPRSVSHFGKARIASLVASVALCIVPLATLWIVRDPGQRDAIGQEATTPAPATPATEPPAPPSAVDPSLSPELSEKFFSASAEPEPRGIPGLGVTDVLGNLYRFPVGGRFACRGPVPGDEAGSNLWVCSVPSERPLPTYEVIVVGDDPRTVLWVRATVRGASEEAAAEFFGYVAGLCLHGTDEPLNSEAWVEANVASGGQVSAGGAELSFYGTNEGRTLQVVASDVL
jgi:hypothetical protein